MKSFAEDVSNNLSLLVSSGSKSLKYDHAESGWWLGQAPSVAVTVSLEILKCYYSDENP